MFNFFKWFQKKPKPTKFTVEPNIYQILNRPGQPYIFQFRYKGKLHGSRFFRKLNDCRYALSDARWSAFLSFEAEEKAKQSKERVRKSLTHYHATQAKKALHEETF